MGLDVQGPSLPPLALYQHQMGESGSCLNKIGGPILGPVSHYKDILFFQLLFHFPAQLPSATVHSGPWERGLWMETSLSKGMVLGVCLVGMGEHHGGLAIWATIPGSQQ